MLWVYAEKFKWMKYSSNEINTSGIVFAVSFAHSNIPSIWIIKRYTVNDDFITKSGLNSIEIKWVKERREKRKTIRTKTKSKKRRNFLNIVEDIDWRSMSHKHQQNDRKKAKVSVSFKWFKSIIPCFSALVVQQIVWWDLVNQWSTYWHQ